MKNYKNNSNISEKGLAILLMISILAMGGLELVLPRTVQADSILQTPVSIGTMPLSQSNTLLPILGFGQKPKAVPQSNITLSVLNSGKTADNAKSVIMKITAYSSEEGQTDSTPLVTASGKQVADGIVANNLLPFGAKIKIPALYGNKVFVVQDRMNKKKSDYHLDIWMPDTSKAINFGSQIAYVEILEK